MLVVTSLGLWSDTDGSLVDDKDSGVSSFGFVGFGTAGVGIIGMMMFMMVLWFPLVEVSVLSLGPFQSVQRAEMWVVILTVQSSNAVHLGVDNLGVVRHVGRLLDGRHGPTPFERVQDGDLLLLIQRMLQLRGLGTARITKVKGHADQGMVLDGRVREIDKLGNDAADEAADFGRGRVGNLVIHAWRNLSEVCGRWSSVILDLHRFCHCHFSSCGES